MHIICPQCGVYIKKSAGSVNRAKKIGAPIYCGRACAGMGRRKNISAEEKREAKRLYDARRRMELKDRIKATKAEYHKRTYDPVRAASERKKRMPWHVEYCRRPEYKAWKRAYDEKYRAQKDYGDFWECHLLAMQIRAEALKRMTDYEIRLEKGTLNKRETRRRAAARINSEKPEIGPLGNLERGQKR